MAVRADKIDDYIRSEMAKRQIPGLTLGVFKDGKPVKMAAYGKSDLELNTPVTIDDLFEIGSCTKQFTAAATLLLAERGKLSIEDPVSKWIPEAPASWSQLTLRHLLFQMSGLQDYALVPGVGLTDSYDRATWFSKMAPLPMDFEPGAAWAYSNTNYALLGYVVEKASGVPYTQFVTDNILKPLGMTHTVFVDPYAVIPHRSHGFMVDSGSVIRAPYSGGGIQSDGTLASTIGDLEKWDQALRERKILSPASYALMWSRAKLNSGRTRAYGTGWFLSQLWEPDYVGHGGNSSGYSAGICRYTKAGITVLLLCNLYPVSGEPMGKHIAEIVDPSLKAVAPNPAPDPDSARTGEVRDAMLKLGSGTPDGTVMEDEVVAPLKTARAKQFPSPYAALKDIKSIAFCSELPNGDDKWLTYRVETAKGDYTLRVLWSKAGKLASAALTPVS